MGRATGFIIPLSAPNEIRVQPVPSRRADERVLLERYAPRRTSDGSLFLPAPFPSFLYEVTREEKETEKKENKSGSCPSDAVVQASGA